MYGRATHRHVGVNEECASVQEQAFLPLYEGDAAKGVRRDDAVHPRDAAPCLYWDLF